MEVKVLHKYPIQGIPIKDPISQPLKDDVLLGYEIFVLNDRNDSLFVKPKPSKINKKGWISIILCVFCCLPLACVPCFLSCSYERYQIPVYGQNLDTSYILVIKRNNSLKVLS